MNPISVSHLLKSITNAHVKRLFLEKLAEYDRDKTNVFLYYSNGEIRCKFIY
jgi:hypothetical protein